MDPQALRAAFRLAMLIFALALLMLPFQDRRSPEFVATVLAAVVGAIFLLAVFAVARLSAPSLPRHDVARDDKRPPTAFNVPVTREGSRKGEP